MICLILWWSDQLILDEFKSVHIMVGNHFERLIFFLGERGPWVLLIPLMRSVWAKNHSRDPTLLLFHGRSYIQHRIGQTQFGNILMLTFNIKWWEYWIDNLNSFFRYFFMKVIIKIYVIEMWFNFNLIFFKNGSNKCKWCFQLGFN